MSGLLKSRKFWIAVFAVVQSLVLHYFQVPDEIWQTIAGLAGVLIFSIATEDAGNKSGTEVHIHDDTNPETPDPEIEQQ